MVYRNLNLDSCLAFGLNVMIKAVWESPLAVHFLTRNFTYKSAKCLKRGNWLKMKVFNSTRSSAACHWWGHRYRARERMSHVHMKGNEGREFRDGTVFSRLKIAEKETAEMYSVTSWMHFLPLLITQMAIESDE